MQSWKISCHCSFDSPAVLYSHFSKIITRRNPDPELIWPAYSPDLNPCDNFLWSHIKNTLQLQGKINTVDELKCKISNIINDIPMDMIKRVVDRFPKQIEKCIQESGSHFD